VEANLEPMDALGPPLQPVQAGSLDVPGSCPKGEVKLRGSQGVHGSRFASTFVLPHGAYHRRLALKTL